MSLPSLLAFLMIAFCMSVGVVSERFVGVLVSFSLSLRCHCFTIVIKQGFISCSVIWRLLHECYNLQIFVSMKVSFFYNVISSKFACGFFRLAILKF